MRPPEEPLYRSNLLNQNMLSADPSELIQTTSISHTFHYTQRTSLPSRVRVQPNDSSSQICLVCGKPSCRLVSHTLYSLNHRSSTNVLIQGSQQAQIPVPLVSPLVTQMENPRIDPFARYPITMTYDEHLLLDLWAQPWGVDEQKGPERSHFPTAYTHVERLRPYAIQYPLILRAVLSLITTQRSLARGPIDEAAYNQQALVSKLHMEAIQLPGQARSDENIIAGLAVMSNYMAQGQIDQGMRLLDGLFQMVKDRGGPQYLGMKGLVSRYVLMSDHMQSIVRCCKPLFALHLPSLQFPIETTLIQGRGFQDLKTKQVLDPRLCTAAIDLCRTMQIFQLGCREKISQQQVGAFEYLSGIAEYQLGILHAEFYHTSQRNSCVCLALLILNHVVLRNAGAIAPTHRLMESRFWIDFQAADAAGGWDEVDEYFLIWVILTPLIIAIRAPCPRADAAIERLQVIQRRAKIAGWEELKSKVLQPYLWFETAQGELLRGIWEKVEDHK